MWCQHCQQEGPAVPVATGPGFECERCQQIAGSTGQLAFATKPTHSSRGATASEQFLDPQVEQRMRQIGRSLRSQTTLGSAGAMASGTHQWVDLPHAENRADGTGVAGTGVAQPSSVSKTSKHSTSRAASKPRQASAAGEQRLQWLAWLTTVFGLGVAAGGVSLLGMGLLGEQPEFWKWGVGLALAGQALLIAGLVRVLMSLWSNSRQATKHLAQVQHELAQVQRTADAIVAQRPGGASGFYGDLARGASPAVLLSNLKGQVDHLAGQVCREV